MSHPHCPSPTRAHDRRSSSVFPSLFARASRGISKKLKFPPSLTARASSSHAPRSPVSRSSRARRPRASSPRSPSRAVVVTTGFSASSSSASSRPRPRAPNPRVSALTRSRLPRVAARARVSLVRVHGRVAASRAPSRSRACDVDGVERQLARERPARGASSSRLEETNECANATSLHRARAPKRKTRPFISHTWP